MTSGHNEPILAIDFGTRYSSAYLVPPRGGEPVPVRERHHGFRWPSAVLASDGRLLVGSEAEAGRKDASEASFVSEFKRDLGNPDQVAGTGHSRAGLVQRMIEEMAARASEDLDALSPVRPARLGRTVLTVPESYRDPVNYGPPWTLRGLMVSSAEAAGLGPVELLPEPVAAAWGLRDAFPRDSSHLVLVYDFGGGTFDTALIQIGPADEWHVLGTESERVGGMDIDRAVAALLKEKLAGQHGDWMTAALGQGRAADADQRRYRFDVNARTEAERLKIQLTEGTSDLGRVLGSPLVEFTREELHDLARSHIATTISCYRRLLGKADREIADLSAVVLTGGTTRMPLVREMVEADLRAGLPPGTGPLIGDLGLDIDLAVARGAALWACDPGNEIEPLAPLPARSGGSVLRWHLDDPARLNDPARPGHGAPSLMRWHAEPGQPYGPGAPLARVRYPDGTLWDLTARRAGVLGQLLAEPGETDEAAETGAAIESRQWLATAEGTGNDARL